MAARPTSGRGTAYGHVTSFRHSSVSQRPFSTARPKKSRHLFAKTFAGIFAVGTGVYVWDRYSNSSTISRSLYALSTFGVVALKYYYIDYYNDPDDLHESASAAIYKMLMSNKGMYIKLGQALANQGSLFPLAYQKRFVKLYDEAPVDTWESVDATLKKYLGPEYESQVFQQIDHEPIASASIAQVHRATLANGDKVAVKVQHHYIEDQVAADMWCYRLIVRVQEKVFDMPMTFYTQYVSDQTILETKFKNELQNAEKLRSFIANDRSARNLGIHIPKNYPEYSDDKVLVSEWIDGVSLTDKKRLIDGKYNLGTIMNQFVLIFGKQIFSYGFVHCDPHPGNLLVRRVGRQQQLVILDHGLYVNMPEKFRREYAQLWKYIMSVDRKGLENVANEWGVTSVDFLSTSIQLKPADMDKSVSASMRTKKSKHIMKEFLSDTSKFPLDLFFLGRAMRIIQTCNKNFGSPVNRINVFTGNALDALIVKSAFSDYLTLLRLKVMLFGSSVVFWVFRLRQIWNGDRYGYKGLGIEDVIERRFRRMAHNMGVDLPPEQALTD
ncbi:hypothetical protein PSN45_002060 [Yamadazyma tenuis]|uniref:ABC1-domain-containing protein n=1 Tax=Candida tenuis (strain ATCC 10573 / BCRC 21748 / CBS 615 / JCM 9827 / NBRC 10315 / NRRL Y-1498 / VKM Y-70) TaxID=590646 RepID=G3BCL5_CANTC|nr:ABC1-domain-containing protein [Yamadazyma tenuis ATCC 10573]EGV60195.1 ABC1-domain-containing protein [Yamadazyma tenuis ATCC 10573]WEJ94569.1 hypothetical protein PSN45_002060 [Yamadazyma tenuis]